MALIYTPEAAATPDADATSDAQTTYEEFLDILAGLSLSPASLSIDIDRKRVQRNRNDVELTTQEFALLAYLVLRADTAVSREELFAHVWAHRSLDTHSRTVDAHIRRLRVKLDDPDLISTVRGAGYRFNSSPTVAITATQVRAGGIALAA